MKALQGLLKKRTAGKPAWTAVTEFAFILPLLVLLAIPIFDVARAIQANMILIHISREGAYLASRSSETPQTIMNTIAATASPLDMGDNGMIYITKVMGNREGDTIRNVIVQQDRWITGGYTPASSLWTCGAWNRDGSCSSLSADPNLAPTANVMTKQLLDGEVIYVVESFYRTNIMFGAMNLGFGITTPQLSPNLHAMTIF